MAAENETGRVPSIAELRQALNDTQPRIGTGWPALDAVTEGVPVGRTTAVRGPQDLRLQVLARMAAWAAGEGYPTMIASRSVTTTELWLAVGGGGIGLPLAVMRENRSHDAWIDDRLRVLDVRVCGDHNAHEKVGTELLRRTPTLLIIDDYLNGESHWDAALDPIDRQLDLNVTPRRLGCALVLGGSSMETFSDWLDRAALTMRIRPDDDGSRTRLSAYEGLASASRTVLLRDGFLEPPRLGLPMIRREGVRNIWDERTPEDISRFAQTLAAHASEVEFERDDHPRDGGSSE